MNVVYDPDKNIVQIALSDRPVAETAQIAPDLILDYDEDGQVVGVELRNASKQIDNPLTLTYTVGAANLDNPQPYSSRS